MPQVYGALDLVKNELRNAVVQNLGTAPPTPLPGQLYYDTANSVLYWYDGGTWIPAMGGAGAVPSDSVSTQAVGDAPVPGVSTLFARGDHKHGMPAFGAVVAEDTFGLTAADGTAVTLARADHTHGSPTHTAADHTTIPWSSFAPSDDAPDNGGFPINNVGAPVAPADAANKQYVDDAINGLSWKDTVRAATDANIALTGAVTVDGVAVADGDRVLVKDQTAPAENGIYDALTTGAWTRSADADDEGDLLNMAVFVSEGTANADTAWTLTTDAPITVDTTDLVYAQFGAGATYVAGAGLTLTGNTLAVGQGTGIIVGADDISVDPAVLIDPAVVVRKFAQDLAGSASPETITHSLGTQDVHVSVHNGAAPFDAVEVDWSADTANTITVRYSPALGAGYRVAVMG